MLIDDGQWHRYKIEFDPYKSGYWYIGPAHNTIRVFIEDWAGMPGVPGDAYFDNVKIEIKRKSPTRGRCQDS